MTSSYKLMQAGRDLLAASKVATTHVMGVAPYPGSTVVYNRTAGALMPCTVELCRESVPVRPIPAPTNKGAAPRDGSGGTVQDSVAGGAGGTNGTQEGRVYYNTVSEEVGGPCEGVGSPALALLTPAVAYVRTATQQCSSTAPYQYTQ